MDLQWQQPGSFFPNASSKRKFPHLMGWASLHDPSAAKIFRRWFRGNGWVRLPVARTQREAPDTRGLNLKRF